MKRSLLVVCFFSFIAISAFSQDSLRIAKEIDRAHNTRSSNPDSSLIYAENALKWASLNHNNFQIGRALSLKGVHFHIVSKPDSALKYYSLAIDFFKKARDVYNQKVVSINLGTIYQLQGKYETALALQLDAYEYFNTAENQKIEKNQKLLMNSMRGIARIYSLTGDHSKALPYFQKIYEKLKDSGDSINLAHAISDLGTVHVYLKDYEKAQKYIQNAIELFTRNNDIPAKGSSFQSLGNIAQFQGNFDLSRSYFLKALDCYQTSGFQFGFCQTYYNLGCLEDTLGRPQAAIPYFLKSITYSKQLDDQQLLANAQKRLAAAYAKTGNYKDAYATQLSFYENSQKVMNSEKQKALAEMETKFQTLQKDKEIEEQNAKLALQEYQLLRNRQYLYASLSFSAIFILLFFFLKSRTKLNRLKLQEAHNHEIQQERMMAIIDSQEQERKRFTSDLHDSFGQLISILKININDLADSSENPSIKRLEKFQECKSVINEMYQELRNVVFDLMPQTLINGGIEPALNEFAERISRSGRIAAESLYFGLSERMNQEAEVALYRICQEWTNNILKYSDARIITIQITADDTELTLTIEDDGKGFNKQLLLKGKGNGWKNINSRASLLGGKLDLETVQDKKGNLLILNIPLEAVVGAEKKIPA